MGRGNRWKQAEQRMNESISCKEIVSDRQCRKARTALFRACYPKQTALSGHCLSRVVCPDDGTGG